MQSELLSNGYDSKRKETVIRLFDYSERTLSRVLNYTKRKERKKKKIVEALVR